MTERSRKLSKVEFYSIDYIRVLAMLAVIFIHKIFVAQKPITFRWWEECHAPFYP